MPKLKAYLLVAYFLLLVGIIAMLSPSTCSILQERNRELDKFSGIKVALASTSDEGLSLSKVKAEITRARDIHRLWLDFLVNNPQWLKDHKDMVDQLPTLYSPEWHRYWIEVYEATLHYLKQVP